MAQCNSARVIWVRITVLLTLLLTFIFPSIKASRPPLSPQNCRPNPSGPPSPPAMIGLNRIRGSRVGHGLKKQPSQSGVTPQSKSSFFLNDIINVSVCVALIRFGFLKSSNELSIILYTGCPICDTQDPEILLSSVK